MPWGINNYGGYGPDTAGKMWKKKCFAEVTLAKKRFGVVVGESVQTWSYLANIRNVIKTMLLREHPKK